MPPQPARNLPAGSCASTHSTRYWCKKDKPYRNRKIKVETKQKEYCNENDRTTSIDEQPEDQIKT